MDELIEELQTLVDDWSEALHSDTEQMRASHLWMKYEAENDTRTRCAKKLNKILAKYKSNDKE